MEICFQNKYFSSLIPYIMCGLQHGDPIIFFFSIHLFQVDNSLRWIQWASRQVLFW